MFYRLFTLVKVMNGIDLLWGGGRVVVVWISKELVVSGDSTLA